MFDSRGVDGADLQLAPCFVTYMTDSFSLKKKLDRVAPLMTDPPLISSTTLSKKNK